MSGNIREFFPGGNTSKGFYSYYHYILEQREADSIICIKGGPGTGKSTFMKSIAEHFLNKGEDVDFFRCSSDPDSLDGILLKKRHIAFLDGTSPHIVDPANPGAVDRILYLGDYWNGAALKKYKSYIMKSNDTIKQWFNCAYANLKCASVIISELGKLYDKATVPGEPYKMAAGIINRELSHKPVTIAEGKCKKYFASAITPKGYMNLVGSLIKSYKKLYLFSVPVGFDTKEFMRILSENIVHRGYCAEQFYCPMDPADKIEHILVPELEIGFLTSNDYHESDCCGCDAEIINIDMREFIDWNYLEKYTDVITFYKKESKRMLDTAIDYLNNAKREHDVLEGYYVPNMNFQKIGNLIDEWIAKIEHNEV